MFERLMSDVFPDPSLRIHTVYFHDADRAFCQRLGHALYGLLTRPHEDPLADGPSIWVSVGAKYDRLASLTPEIDVMIPVLGPGAAVSSRVRTAAFEWIAEAAARLTSKAVLPVLEGSLWPILEPQLRRHAQPLRVGPGEPVARLRDVRFKLIKAICRFKGPEISVLVSFDTSDRRAESIAEAVADAVVNEPTPSGFHDRNPWTARLSDGSDLLIRAMAVGAETPVLIALRGGEHLDVQSQRELVTAKLHQCPVLWLDDPPAERFGESHRVRLEPHAANLRGVVWRGQAQPVVEAALVEWLRAYHFRHQAEALRDFLTRLGGPEAAHPAEIRTRAPEPIDVADWWRYRRGPQTIFHPDPELPTHDRELLRNAYPRLRFRTPSTLFRGATPSRSRFPLAGHEVAISISEGPDLGGDSGTTSAHLLDTSHAVARTLLSCGATLSYAGDFRKMGYTERLWALVSAYNQTSTTPADLLHAYLPVNVKVPKAYPIKTRSMRNDDVLKARAAVEFSPHEPSWLFLSDLRRVMAHTTRARVAIGGKSLPRGSDPRPGQGYSGPFPGVVEEAYRTLKQGRPLYVAGGFGGAAQLVVSCLTGTVPTALRQSTFSGNQAFVNLAGELKGVAGDHPTVWLPESIDLMAEELVEMGRKHFMVNGDEGAVAQNGLTKAENELLWTTRDAAAVAALTMKGLLHRVAHDRADQRRVELVPGGWSAADRLDACLLLQPEGEDGGWLRVGAERWAPQEIVDLGFIDSDWVMQVDLPSGFESDSSAGALVEGIREFGVKARERGWDRVGIVIPNVDVALDAASWLELIKEAFERDVCVVVLDQRSPRMSALQTVIDADADTVGVRARARLA